MSPFSNSLLRRCAHTQPAPLHPVVTVGPFAKWAVEFTTCNPASAKERSIVHNCGSELLY